MIKTARQLKDLIRNLSKEKTADAQILMRNYMMERFLERISLSEYRDKFILKGGMLVAAMVGLDVRSTMDMDATIKGANVNVEDVEKLISSIITIQIDDGVIFQIKSISEIMDEAEYPGVRVSMTALFDRVITPLKIDISTGDVITPSEVRYNFKLMLEERTIDIWAYNLETVLAEKLETMLTRAVTNTRMRDFYDIYVLQQLFRVPKIVTFLLLVIAPSSSSPYILYAFALLQGTHAGFHVRMGAFCHVQKLLTACCRSPPCFPPLCSHKISSMYGVRIPLNIIFHIFWGNHRLELAKSAF